MNVAENVPRLILLAMDASVSFMPCFFIRSANSRYETSARASSAFKNRLAGAPDRIAGPGQPMPLGNESTGKLAMICASCT